LLPVPQMPEGSDDMDKRYLVRFVRSDGKPDEVYDYAQKSDAEHHFRLFRDDDSGLYDRIELIIVAGRLRSVADTIRF